MTSCSQADAKSAIRDAAKVRRQLLAQDQPDAGRLLARQGVSGLPALFEPGFAGIVSSYRPIGSELDPGQLSLQLAAQGWTLALPVTPAKPTPGALQFRAWRPSDPLERSSFGIEEPVAGADIMVPDLILVPLLAFDRRGGRLGYGQGHFDRTLAMLRKERQVKAVGLAYAGQELDRLPLEPHDQPLDAILTEREFIPVYRG